MAECGILGLGYIQKKREHISEKNQTHTQTPTTKQNTVQDTLANLIPGDLLKRKEVVYFLVLLCIKYHDSPSLSSHHTYTLFIAETQFLFSNLHTVLGFENNVNLGKEYMKVWIKHYLKVKYYFKKKDKKL